MQVTVTGVPPVRGIALFKDRISERKELGKLLADGRLPMITLLGGGGFGS